MAKTILGEYTLVPSGNQTDKTKVAVEAFVTPGNVSLSAALVAETIESENEALQPAQMAVQAALDYLKQSKETDPHTLILESFQAANREIYDQGRKAHAHMSCSMALALIVDDLMLYVGNLGKTRIYLNSPQGGVAQLTVEHTFMQIMVQQKQMSREKAMAHPKAATVLRSLGTNEDVEADTGLYNAASDFDTAQESGMYGYPLQAGESIVVCSSEFYSTSTTVEEPLVTDAELIRTLETHNGLDAAREILEHAIPRQPTDFIALATLQLPTRRQPSGRSRPSGQRMLIWLTALVMFVVVGLLVLLPSLSQSIRAPALTGTAAVQIALLDTRIAQTVSAYTPTPKRAPTLTPTASVIGLINIGANSDPLAPGQLIEAQGNAVQLDVSNLSVANGNASLFMQPLGRIQIDQVNQTQFSTTLFQNSDVFINSGGYKDGVILYPNGAQNISLSVSGSCMSVDYTAEMLSAACYEGTCTYRIGGPQSPDQVIPMGQEVNIHDQQSNLQPISEDEIQHYRDFLSSTNAGMSSLNTCLESYILPSPTATDTATVQATATATLAPTVTLAPTNTRRPRPTATDTPVPPQPTSPPTSAPSGHSQQSHHPSSPAKTPVPPTALPPTHAPATQPVVSGGDQEDDSAPVNQTEQAPPPSNPPGTEQAVPPNLPPASTPAT